MARVGPQGGNITIKHSGIIFMSYMKFKFFHDNAATQEAITTSQTRYTILKLNTIIWVTYMVRPCPKNGRRKITQNSIEVDAETKQSTRKTEEKLDGRYKEGHERKKPK